MIFQKKTLYFLPLFFFLLLAAKSNAQEQKTVKKESPGRLFNDSTATDSDYLMAIEKAGEVLESAYNDIDFAGDTRHLFGEMKRTESKLELILASLKGANPNVRNQQMYRIVLQEIQQELEEQNKEINTRNLDLEKIKKRVIELRNDKSLMSLIRDTIRRRQFKKEFADLRKRYVGTD